MIKDLEVASMIYMYKAHSPTNSLRSTVDSDRDTNRQCPAKKEEPRKLKTAPTGQKVLDILK